MFQRELGDKLKDLVVNLCESKAQIHEFEAKENAVVDRLLQEIADVKMNAHQMSAVINGLREDMLMVTNYIESQCKSVKCDAAVQTDLYIGGENTDQTQICEMDIADSQIAIDLEGMKLDIVILESKFNRTCVEIADTHKKQKEITQCISRKMDSHEYLTENKKLADRILALNLEMESYKLDLYNVEKNHTSFHQHASANPTQQQQSDVYKSAATMDGHKRVNRIQYQQLQQ